jgi:hypothetical protein
VANMLRVLLVDAEDNINPVNAAAVAPISIFSRAKRGSTILPRVSTLRNSLEMVWTDSDRVVGIETGGELPPLPS